MNRPSSKAEARRPPRGAAQGEGAETQRWSSGARNVSNLEKRDSPRKRHEKASGELRVTKTVHDHERQARWWQPRDREKLVTHREWG